MSRTDTFADTGSQGSETVTPLDNLKSSRLFSSNAFNNPLINISLRLLLCRTPRQDKLVIDNHKLNAASFYMSNYESRTFDWGGKNLNLKT